MTKKQPTRRYVQPYRYASPNIPLTAIRRFARRIAERFQPDKIILFGSYAYGKPHDESDVDLLVIMRARNVIDQSIRILNAFDREFSLDLIVRTPWQIERGFKDDDWFLREIVEKGKVLYEAQTAQWVRKAEQDWEVAHKLGGAPAPRDIVCFHCQQAAEKYLKALMQESGLVVPKIHNLVDLIDLLLPNHASLARLRRRSGSLTQYAVDYRYPGKMADRRQMQAALRSADMVREECRGKLGLPVS